MVRNRRTLAGGYLEPLTFQRGLPPLPQLQWRLGGNDQRLILSTGP